MIELLFAIMVPFNTAVEAVIDEAAFVVTTAGNAVIVPRTFKPLAAVGEAAKLLKPHPPVVVCPLA